MIFIILVGKYLVGSRQVVLAYGYITWLPIGNPDVQLPACTFCFKRNYD